MYALLKHPLLDCDVEEAALWYHLRNPDVAGRFIEESRRVMREVAERPYLHPIHFEGLRSAKLDGFPHRVYYEVRENAVQVVGLIHGARDARAILTERKLSFESE